ncbi:hypothetical protein BJ878DRAFT_522912 [Calycina marina]|uniref:CUE domain-containing protein n=1 Tax=Calycina marina TaxID=1763456 RepID=A0A9P8CBK7_9HELO|nr:hypothetical protein BJ878DRAFT_522912 [Calycina marina]
MSKKAALPPIAAFPEVAWRYNQVPEEWEAALDSWIILIEAHLSLPDSIFLGVSVTDETLSAFLRSFVAELSLSRDTLPLRDVKKTARLRKQCYILLGRLLTAKTTENHALLRWEILADISAAYGNENGRRLMFETWNRHTQFLELSLGEFKKNLTSQLEVDLDRDWREVTGTLQHISKLLRASPEAAELFMAGSDFLDALLSGYAGVFDPTFRETLVEMTYYCLLGLTNGDRPKYGLLLDQLYSLKTATEARKTSYSTAQFSLKDSLVAHLVAETNILAVLRERLGTNNATLQRSSAVLDAFANFQKLGGRPHSNTWRVSKPKRKLDKGKEKATAEADGLHEQVHIHAASLITQVQDIFPELGSGFVAKLLDEYNNGTEQVIAHLLEDSLPSYLASADRSEALEASFQDQNLRVIENVPRSPISNLPTRRNVFDDHEFDKLSSRLHFGRKNPDQTADDVLQDKSTAPNKAAILSALAAFDSDDDERDDTYDTADIGGRVTLEDAPTDSQDIHEETLFLAYKSSPALFGRDKSARSNPARAKLREKVGMTDSAIEGWALVLSRDSRKQRRLEAQFSQFSGQQNLLAPTSWKNSPNGSETEDLDADGRHGSDRGRGLRIRGAPRGRGGGRGRGNVAGPSGDRDTEAARRGKEANKASRANHNRKDQRGKKLARGGFLG